MSTQNTKSKKIKIFRFLLQKNIVNKIVATRPCKIYPHRAERSIPFSEEPLLSGVCSMEEKETIEARK